MELDLFTKELVTWDYLTPDEKKEIFQSKTLKPDKPRINPFIKRWLRTRGSKKCFVETSIYADFFKEHKFLPPDTTLSVSLSKNLQADKFCLLTDKDGDFHIKIESVELTLDTVYADQDFVDIATRNFAAGAKYRTDYPTCQMIRFSEAKGISDIGENDIFQWNSYSPKRFSMVFVDQDAFNGDKKKDPFTYKRHNTRYFALLRGDNCSRHLPVHMDRWKGDVGEGLSNLYTALDLSTNPEESLGIGFENFDQGHFFMAFNLEKTENPAVFSLPDKWSNSLEVRCEPPLTTPIAKIVYAEFNTELLIDTFGNTTVMKNALAGG